MQIKRPSKNRVTLKNFEQKREFFPTIKKGKIKTNL